MTPIFAGTFDPLTHGHVSIIERMVKVFNKGVVLMATNPNKEHMLTGEERHRLIRECLEHYRIKNVGVSATYGFVADWARDLYGDQAVLVRGVRDEKDFLYEQEIAKFNFSRSHVQTMFFPAHADMERLSSTSFKQLLKDDKWEQMRGFVPSPVINFFMNKMYAEKK